jgi:hypothetical protein
MKNIKNLEIKLNLKLIIAEYNENLENFICNEFSGDFQRALRSLINANRDESNRIDKQLSEKEAKVLYEVIENYFCFTFDLL